MLIKTCPKCGAAFCSKQELQAALDVAVMELIAVCNQQPIDQVKVRKNKLHKS